MFVTHAAVLCARFLSPNKEGKTKYMGTIYTILGM